MDNIELWCGDCLELMKNIPDKSIDMILCDPPYGSTQNQWDKTLTLKELWENYLRVIKDNGCIAIFADGMFMAELMKSQSKLWRYNLIWNKVLTSGFLNAQKRPLKQHEEICVFYKKQPIYNPQFTEGKPLHGMGNKYKEKIGENNNYNTFASNNNPSKKKKVDTKKYPTSILTY